MHNNKFYSTSYVVCSISKDSRTRNLSVHVIYLIKEYDIISCSRYSAGGSMENKIHYYFSFAFNLILRIILRTQIQDNLGGYYCIKKNVLDKIQEFGHINYDE